MALIECNGLAVIEAAIVLPRTGGPWYADLLVDGDAPVAGENVTLRVQDGALTLVGTSAGGGDHLEVGWSRIVAGNAGLGAIHPAKFYSRAQLRLPLGDLLRLSGEALSATADQGALGTFLSFWAFVEAPCGMLLAALAAKASGSSWRFLADGSLYVGPESWPATAAELDEVDRDPRERRVTFAAAAPLLLPGTTVGGERVGRVDHEVTGDEVRTVAYLEAA